MSPTTPRDREPAIRVQSIEKSSKELHVLGGVNFEVASGSIFALLGSNGAGKTTMVICLHSNQSAATYGSLSHGASAFSFSPTSPPGPPTGARSPKGVSDKLPSTSLQ